MQIRQNDDISVSLYVQICWKSIEKMVMHIIYKDYINYFDASDGNSGLFEQCHAWWCPGSLSRQGTCRYGIDSIE